MAWYTIEVSGILAAYAKLLDVRTNEQEGFEIVETINGHTIKWDSDNGHYVQLPKYETTKGLHYTNHDFDFFKINNPNYLVEKFAYPCALDHCGELKDNITSDKDLNKSIIDKFIQTFFRYFYGYEIGQENPNYWWLLFKEWYDENIDFFIQNYQQMIIENQNYITGLSHSTGNMQSNAQGSSDGYNSSIAGTADTPQDELNFALNTGDPAKDYNFNYSSSVNGAKSHDMNKSTSDSTQDTHNDMTARNQTIASLSSQLDNLFNNGIYLNLFEKAKEKGLFMRVIH